MPINRNYINLNRSALFDWLVFITCFFLGFVFPSISDVVKLNHISYWMLLSGVLYGVGVWLKRLPLYYRVDTKSEKLREMPYLLFVLVGHWVILYVVYLFSVPAFMEIFHIAVKNPDDPISTTSGLWCLIPSTLVSILVFARNRKKASLKKYNPDYLFYRELLADIFLFSSVSFLTFLFWDKGLLAAFSQSAPRGFIEIFGLFMVIGFMFVLFYLPLRYLYLLEDHSSNQTWRRLLLIFLMLMIRGLIYQLAS